MTASIHTVLTYDHVHFDGGALDTLKFPLDRVEAAFTQHDPTIAHYRKTDSHDETCRVSGECQVWTCDHNGGNTMEIDTIEWLAIEFRRAVFAVYQRDRDLFRECIDLVTEHGELLDAEDDELFELGRESGRIVAELRHSPKYGDVVLFGIRRDDDSLIALGGKPVARINVN